MEYYKEQENTEIPVYHKPKEKKNEKFVFLDSNRISKITIKHKFAAMPIKKVWTNERGQEGPKTLAFVVAPCVVVETYEEYRKKDSTEPVKSYRVVFTWSQDGKENIEPIYEDGKCVNSSPAKEVFSTAKECQDFVNRQNAKLLRRKTQDLFDDEKEAVKVVFIKNERKCREKAFQHLSQKDILDIYNAENEK